MGSIRSILNYFSLKKLLLLTEAIIKKKSRDMQCDPCLHSVSKYVMSNYKYNSSSSGGNIYRDILSFLCNSSSVFEVCETSDKNIKVITFSSWGNIL